MISIERPGVLVFLLLLIISYSNSFFNSSFNLFIQIHSGITALERTICKYIRLPLMLYGMYDYKMV